ncbi:MAG TPA: hypothetical protein VFL42_10740, partial [Terriglobales bacterium]|nr:hypothetical protein [Terriglobales bacterium]
TFGRRGCVKKSAAICCGQMWGTRVAARKMWGHPDRGVCGFEQGVPRTDICVLESTEDDLLFQVLAKKRRWAFVCTKATRDWLHKYFMELPPVLIA